MTRSPSYSDVADAYWHEIFAARPAIEKFSESLGGLALRGPKLRRSEFSSRDVRGFAEATVAKANARRKLSVILDASQSPLIQYCSTLNDAARLIGDSSEWCPHVLLELGQCYLSLGRTAFAIACFERARRLECADSASQQLSAALSLRARLRPFWESYLNDFFGRASARGSEGSAKKPPSEISYLQFAEELRGHGRTASPAYGIVCCELAKLNLVAGNADSARRHAVRAGSKALGTAGKIDVLQLLAICDLVDGLPDTASHRLRGVGSGEDVALSIDLSLTDRLMAKSLKAQGKWKDALHHMDRVHDYLSNSNAAYAARIKAPYFLEKDLHPAFKSEVVDQAAQLAQSILHYIDRNLAATLTLHSIAAALGVSEKELARAVRLAFGVPVRLMVEERRMIAARTALTSNGVACYSIREVGETVGLKHPSTFARRYKHWFNELPAHTRKRST